MTTLYAYFDASFTKPHGGVTTVGGYLGDEQQWMAVKKEWVEALHLWQLSEFHLTHIARHLGHTRGSECARFFARILRRNGLHSIGSTFRDSDWNGSERRSAEAHVYPTAYHPCFDMTLGVLDEHARLEFPGSTVEIIADTDTPNIDAAQNIFNHWHNKGRLTSITFSHVSKHLLLQCADLYTGAARISWLQNPDWKKAEWTDLYFYSHGERGRTSHWSMDIENRV